jgi:hypothetical protein
MVNHGSLFCSNIIYLFIDLSQLRHLRHSRHSRHVRFGLFILQALFEVVGQPTGLFFFEKMTSLMLFDMSFVIFYIFNQSFVKIRRKLMYIYVIWTSSYVN